MSSFRSLCVYWKWPAKIAKYQVWVILLSAFLIHFSLGIAYVFSNMVPYVISYTRVYSSPTTVKVTDAPFITAAHIVGHSLTVSIGGMVERKLGPRLSAMLGIVIVDIGLLLSYWTIQVSFWLFLITYGLIAGVGGGLSYIAPITCAMKWLPKWRGLTTGVIVGGFGLSSVLFDIIQTAYINPLNLPPDFTPKPDEKYFTQPELLKKVPQIFLIQVAVAVVLQIVGCTFLVNPLAQKDDPCKENPANSRDSLLKKADNSDDPTFYKYRLQASKIAKLTNSRSFQDQICNSTPLQALTKKNLYIIWMMFFCTGMASTFVVTLYKAFGLDMVVSDDHFLTILGIFASVCGLLGRLVWGLFGDITSYKTALVCQSAVSTIILLTLYTTTIAGKWMYFIWICIFYFCISGNYSLFPMAISQSFGQTYMGIIYGFVFTSHTVSGIAAAFVISELVKIIGWNGLLLALSGFSGLEFALILGYEHKTYAS